MAAPYRPPSTKQFQAENWYWVPTLASQAAPTATELAAAGVIEMTGYTYTDFVRPSRNTNLVTRERRIADPAQYQQVGTGTWTGGTINYSTNPQAASGAADRKLFDAFASGATGYFVQRVGIDVNTAIATGQKVNVFPVNVDYAAPIQEGQDDAGEAAMTNTYTVTGPPSLLVAVA